MFGAATPANRSSAATGADPPQVEVVETSWFQRLGWLPHVVSLLLFALAIWVIHRELAAYRPADLFAHLAAIPTSALALALIAAALGYGALTLFDPLALSYLGKGLPYRQTVASFIGYAFSHNLGLGWLSGGAVRYRLYSAWGLSSLDIGGILAFNTVTTFLGLGTILALACLGEPAEVAAILRLPRPAVVVSAWPWSARLPATFWPRLCGGLPSGLPAGSSSCRQPWPRRRSACRCSTDARRRRPLHPAADRLAARFPAVRRPVRARQSGRADQQRPGRHRRVRGGGPGRGPGCRRVGRGRRGADRLPADLLPSAARGGRAPARRPPVPGHGRAGQAGRLLGAHLAPNLFALIVFVAGIMLLATGVSPTIAGRMQVLAEVVPLGVIELSHFLGSIAGLLLLLVAWGLRRRLDGAYLATLLILMAGVVFSLLRGLHVEQAAVLALTLLALVPCRRAFYRKTALLTESFSSGWLLAVAAVLLGILWLGFFSHRHVEYSNDLWWRFVVEEDALGSCERQPAR